MEQEEVCDACGGTGMAHPDCEECDGDGWVYDPSDGDT
jgi:DnaJ-class molecular chaperone